MSDRTIALQRFVDGYVDGLRRRVDELDRRVGFLEQSSNHGSLSNPIVDPLLLRPQDVAVRLQVSRSKAYQLIKTGALPSVEIGGSVRVRPADLGKYLDDQRRTSQAIDEDDVPF